MKRALVLSLLLTACPPTDKPPPDPGKVYPEGGSCTAACEHMRSLDCELGKPTPKGAPCVEVCKNADNNGFPWPVQCMLGSTTCEQLEACE